MKRMRSVWGVGLTLILIAGCSSGSDDPNNGGVPSALPAGTAQALPLLSVTTTDSPAPITSKEIYRPADYVLKDESRTVLIQGTTEIRGRGNTTWDLMPKKPYHLRLTTSSSLLGMPANRHWVLLANYADKTLLRNDITFQLSRWMGMEYTSRSKFVEVELNGTYLGIYQLTEHIRIAPDRVNIPQLKSGDTALSLITGGYLIEVDSRRDEDFCWDSPRFGIAFCFKDPETLLESGWETRKAYIEQYLRDTEDAIFGNNFTNPTTGLSYAAYIDVDSLIQYYLVNELVKNIDGALDQSLVQSQVYSTYMYKKRDGKLFFGPVWDFDIAMGNLPDPCCAHADGWHIQKAAWFTRLFEDPVFAEKVKAKWNQFKANGHLEELFQYIDKQALYLNHVQVKNFQKWRILSIPVWPFPPDWPVPGSYHGEITAVKNWLRDRINWMDAQFNP